MPESTKPSWLVNVSHYHDYRNDRLSDSNNAKTIEAMIVIKIDFNVDDNDDFLSRPTGFDFTRFHFISL